MCQSETKTSSPIHINQEPLDPVFLFSTYKTVLPSLYRRTSKTRYGVPSGLLRLTTIPGSHDSARIHLIDLILLSITKSTLFKKNLKTNPTGNAEKEADYEAPQNIRTGAKSDTQSNHTDEKPIHSFNKSVHPIFFELLKLTLPIPTGTASPCPRGRITGAPLYNSRSDNKTHVRTLE
jgi:hypothetical protein